MSFSPHASVEGGVEGAISFNEALREQLGLKLEARKRPLPVLAIDRIAETAEAN